MDRLRVRRRGPGDPFDRSPERPQIDVEGGGGTLDDVQQVAAGRPSRWTPIEPPVLHSLLSWMILLGTVVVVVVVIHIFDASLPTPLPVDVRSDRFSEGRAREHLQALAALGPRLVGSEENEMRAKYFIVQSLRAIQAEATELKLRKLMEIDIQEVSGSFTLQFLRFVPFTNTYDQVTNIVVRISEGEGSRENALLVNSHYDSAMSSPGAGDALSCLSSMVEMVRNVLFDPHPLENAVIFNFNSAEETLFHASHGFITQHKWRKTIRAVLNMDSAGSGGKSLLFQCGPANAWLAKAFASTVPHPRASSLAQDLFQANVIPSDTDYRIFRDVGHIPGVDLAFYKNGYVYHTPLDAADAVTAGSLQHLGDNALALIRAFTRSTSPYAPHLRPYGGKGGLEASSAVFFDVFGVFMVAYTKGTSVLLSGMVIAITWLLVFFNLSPGTVGFHIKGIWRALKCLLAGAVASLAGALALACVVRYILLSPMSWFSRPWFCMVLYGFPTLLAMVTTLEWSIQRNVRGMKTRKQVTEHFFCAALVFWTLLLAGTSLAGLGSSYLPMIWVGFPGIGFLFYSMTEKRRTKALAYLGNEDVSKSKDVPKGHSWALCVAGGCVPPLLIHLDILFAETDMFIPLMGRIGQRPPIPSELLVALLIGAMLFLSLLFFMSVLANSGNLWIIRYIALLGVLVCAVVAYHSFPFSAACPQRVREYLVQHTYLPGIFPTSNTVVTTVDDTGHGISTRGCRWCGGNSKLVSFDVDTMPYAFPLTRFMHRAVVFNVGKPPIDQDPIMRLVEERQDPLHRSVHLTIAATTPGTSYAMLKIFGTVLSWSFSDVVPPPEPEGFRFVRHGGSGEHVWTFEIEVPREERSAKKTTTFVLSGVYFIDTPVTRAVAMRLPPYAVESHWVTVITQYDL